MHFLNVDRPELCINVNNSFPLKSKSSQTLFVVIDCAPEKHLDIFWWSRTQITQIKSVTIVSFLWVIWLAAQVSFKQRKLSCYWQGNLPETAHLSHSLWWAFLFSSKPTSLSQGPLLLLTPPSVGGDITSPLPVSL